MKTLVLFTLLYIPLNLISQCPDPVHPDYDALIQLYNQTNGPNWTNNTGWIGGATGTNCNPCNGWQGISCSNGRVSDISLSNNNLIGSLPVELIQLETNITVNLSNNDLSGCIPLSYFDFFCTNSNNWNLSGNLKMPWMGDFSQFCQSMTQIGAPCNDGNPNSNSDSINLDCSCGTNNVVTGECEGQNPAENTEFLTWLSDQSILILNNANSPCGGVLEISDDYEEDNWIENGSCSFEINIEWTVIDDCGSSSLNVSATYIISDSTPPSTEFASTTFDITCLSDLGGAPPIDALDDCEGTVTITPTVDDSGVVCESDGVVIFEYEIVDACGNVSPDSPVTLTVNIAPTPGDALEWINPGDNLPPDLSITLNQNECQNEFPYPNCVWSEDPGDMNATTYPFPLLPGVHYNDPCGTAVFTFTQQPCSIFPASGDILVTYTVDDGCGPPLVHEFTISPTCANCVGGGLFCGNCETARPNGCFTCNVNDLLQGFSSCNPPYLGTIQQDQPSPLCNGNGVPNNMSWFAFVAGSPAISVDVTPTECIASGGTIGIQSGIYDMCDGECIAGTGFCSNALDVISYSLGDLNIGQTYYLFVDGCNGAECNYEISISGQEAFILDDYTAVTVETDCDSPIPDKFCPGQIVRFNTEIDGATGFYGPAGGPYDPDADLCFEWSFTPDLDGVTSEIYNQLEEGAVTPDFEIPDVDQETIITVCLDDVTGPCEEPCDDADCVDGDCCLDLVIAPLPDESCEIDVCIETLMAGFDPSGAFESVCGGGIAGWLGGTNITLADVDAAFPDPLVFEVTDPTCNCTFEQSILINVVGPRKRTSHMVYV